MNPRRRRFFRALAALTLSLGVGLSALFGLHQTIQFETTPGERVPGPAIWPTASRIPRQADRETVLVFAHPFCSCSGATLSELAEILERPRSSGEIPAVRVTFFRPKGGAKWEATELWAQAEKLPGATVSWDEGGREARLFNARTSGLVLLYGKDGRLRFQGGVTGSRGHVGSNFAAQQLVQALDRHTPGASAFFVFGCSLLGRHS